MADKNIFLYGLLKTSKESIKLTRKRISIGRNKNSQIVINNNTISKDHAILEFDEDYNCIIKDLNSSNGTYVNGQRLKTIPLKLRTGDKIKFGNYDIEYTFESSNMLNDTKTEQEITVKLSQNINEINEENEEMSHKDNNIIKDGKISLVNENELSYPKINHFQNKKNILYSFGNSNGMNYNSEPNTNSNINNQLDNNKPQNESNNINNNNEDEIVEQYNHENNFNTQNSLNFNQNNCNNFKNKCEEYEKMKLLEKENMQIKDLLNDKTNKLKQLNILFDELNEEYSKLNSKHNDLINYTSDIKKKLDSANKEISEFKINNINNNNNEENELIETVKQKDNIIQILQNELNYYKELCNKKGMSTYDQDENIKINNKLNTISNIFVNENNKLKKKLEFYKNKFENSEINQKQYNINFKEFETQMNYQIDNFNNIISNYNSKLLDTLNKITELFESNNKEQAAKYLVDQINEYMIENQKLISENSKLNTQILELQSIINSEYKNRRLNTNKNINNYELSDDNIEIDKNNNSEIYKLKSKINEMENVVVKLKDINTNNKYKNDYNNLKNSFVNLLNELKNKEKVIENLQTKLKNVIERNTINFDENQIVKSISQKLKEKDNIIKKLENQINSTKNFDNQDSKQRIENIRKKRGLFN